jgi:putative ABC transport system ATP-binding protein
VDTSAGGPVIRRRDDLGGLAMLQLRQVSKTYGAGPSRVQALSDVSLTVPAGALVAVVGPSGSGKSSLLAIAGGLVPPTSGGVVLAGVRRPERHDRDGGDA